MKVKRTLLDLDIDGEFRVVAPEGWGEEGFSEHREFGLLERDYDILARHIEDLLDESDIPIDAKIDFVENAGEEKERIRFVVER